MAMLCLRSTPLSHDLPSPAELLNGRVYQTNLPAVLKLSVSENGDTNAKLQFRQHKQKKKYDKTARQPFFHSSQETAFTFLIHPAIYGSQVLSSALQIPRFLTWWPLRKVEHSEETVTISVGLESLFSSLKVWSLRMPLLLTPAYKLLIIKNVDQAVTLFPLEVMPVLLLSQNLCFLARLRTLLLPRSVDPAGGLKFQRD